MPKLLKILVGMALSFCLGVIVTLLFGYLQLKPVAVPVSGGLLKQRSTDLKASHVYLPKAFVPKDIITSDEELLDKCVSLGYTIPKGAFFYKAALEECQKISDGLLYELRSDEVTYDLLTRDVSLNAAYLKKGMYTDIYLTIRGEKVSSGLLVSGARILGLYNLNGEEAREKETVATVTLALKSEQVAYVNKALVAGSLRISVCNEPFSARQSQLHKDSEVFKAIE